MRGTVRVAGSILFTSLAAAAFPQDARPLPEGNAYVRELNAESRRQDEAIDSYSYDFEEIREELDGDGRVKSKKTRRSHVYFVQGRPVRRLMSENGVPLNPKKQAEEDRRALEQARAIREGRNVHERPGLRLAVLFDRFEFTTEARELRDGRDTLVLSFRPRPNTTTSNDPGDALSRVLRGRVWIDEKARRVVRLEARNVDGESASVRFGVRVGDFGLVAEFQRLPGSEGSDGVWLPVRTETLATGRAFLFRKFRVRQTTVYSNYRRFSIETEEKR